MSEPKLISPLLDHHLMGAPISAHHGVRCCPALNKENDHKYIVKIISLPATRVQLDALLLTGACQNEADAQEYFLRQAKDVTDEAELLQKLSNLEGFHSYEAWQIHPMEEEIGCDVYLLGRYHDTLARHLTVNPLSHLAAVNLGLDLCSALALSRRHGYLYVDLRPENIILTENREFRIADLGFINLDSLKYQSLPEKYRSAYTAPEIEDAYASLNTTLDTYAAGLILYQVFNDGKLPESAETMDPPAYADYDMAAIILKACAADPAERWQDPQAMAQALITYMQSHNVNDTPIIPVVTAEPEESPVEEATDTDEPEVITEEEQVEAVSEEPVEEAPASKPVEEASCEEEPVAEEESPAEEHIPDELEVAEQFVIDGFLFDEADTPADEDPFSEEVDQMLAQADELIAHQTPDPVIAPEPVDIPMPEPLPIEEEEEVQQEISLPEESGEAKESEDAADDAEPAQDVIVVSDTEETPISNPKNHKKLTAVISTLLVILLVVMLAAGGLHYHQNIYLQRIDDLTVDVMEDQAVVTVDSDLDPTLLTVICTDIYGNSRQQSLVDGTAIFSGLNAGTAYKITLSVSGHHKLVGTTTASFTTATQTKILSFTAITADSDGSVILNFSVQGPDSKTWYIHYSTPGEPEREVVCSGHMVTITGLTVGAEYTFWLVPEEELYIIGTESITFTAQPVIYAQDLTVHGYSGGNLLVSWNAPEGMTVDSWIVRCYNSNGYDRTITVTDTTVALEGLNPALSYTVDVKAAGMSVSKWTTINANSITIQNLTISNLVDGLPSDLLTITWSFEGTAPENGWQIYYSVNGGEPQLITTTETTATISPVIPGAEYSISFVMPEGITVYGGTAQYTAPYAVFDHLGALSENFTFRMCWTPEDEDWRWYHLWERDFTNTYKIGERASFVVHVDGELQDGQTQLSTLFLIRAADGTLVHATTSKTLDWATMWDKNYTELDMPLMPETAGDYTVEIYFNQSYVSTIAFTITE